MINKFIIYKNYFYIEFENNFNLLLFLIIFINLKIINDLITLIAIKFYKIIKM